MVKEAKRKWDLLSSEQRAAAVQKIIGFFNVERQGKIGVLAAEKMLDLF